jgi:hypothetical protein
MSSNWEARQYKNGKWKLRGINKKNGRKKVLPYCACWFSNEDIAKQFQIDLKHLIRNKRQGEIFCR